MSHQLTGRLMAQEVARFRPSRGLNCADLHAQQFAHATEEIRPAPYLTRWAVDKLGALRPARPGEFTWLITHNN